MSAVTLDQFRRDFRSGGFSSIAVMASGGLFYVTAQSASGEPVMLGTLTREARGFRDPGSAIALLHEIGARRIEVDTSAWDPQHTPPDPEHDLWFRAEVEQALQEANDPGLARIPNEEVASNWAAQRAELMKRPPVSS